jgi:hypothetical protein
MVVLIIIMQAVQVRIRRIDHSQVPFKTLLVIDEVKLLQCQV